MQASLNLIFAKIHRPLMVLGLVAGAASIAGYFGRAGWIFDLCSQFRLCYVYLFVVLAVLYLRRRTWWLRSTFLFLLVMNAASAYSDMIPAARSAPTSVGLPLRVMQMNIWVLNHDFSRVCNYVRRSGADVVGIEEYTRAADSAFLQLGLFHDYPYHLVVSTSDQNSEMCLLSRYPLSNVRMALSSVQNDRSMIADATIGEKRVTIVLMHPRTPVRPTLYERACRQFHTLGLLRSTMQKQVIVIGDLNTTQYSWKFSDLLDSMRLYDTRLGYGPAPTWLVWLPVLPIDFVLVSPSIQTRHFAVGAPTGSDHSPVIVDLDLKPAQL